MPKLSLGVLFLAATFLSGASLENAQAASRGWCGQFLKRIQHPQTYWLQEAREKQRDVAQKIVKALLGESEKTMQKRIEFLSSYVVGGEPEADRAKLVEKYRGYDLPLTLRLFEEQAQQDTIGVVHAYTDWVLAKLVNDEVLALEIDEFGVALPEASDELIATLAKHTGATTALTKQVVFSLVKEKQIPLLGATYENDIMGKTIARVDVATLRKWAALYDWDAK